MKVKVKKLHEDAVLPKYATPGASGFDFHALEEVSLAPGETKLIKTGLAMSVGHGFELQVRPRSGLSLKTSLRVANSPGSVDSDYTGEICVIMTNIYSAKSPSEAWERTVRVAKGDRVAQGVVCPVFQVELEVVDSLETTERGDGGFGHTGT